MSGRCLPDWRFILPGWRSNGRETKIPNGFSEAIIDKYESVLAANQIEVAGIEFIRNTAGEIYTYDINKNTNYNSDAEAKAGKYGMLQLAKYLKAELGKLTDSF